MWFPHWLFWVPFHSCYSLAAAAQFITPIYMIQSVVQLVVFCTCSFRKLCIRGSQPFLPMHLFSSCHNVVPHLQDYLTQQVHSKYSEKYYLLFNCALYIVSLMHFAGLPSLHVLLMSTVWPIKIIGITSVIFAKRSVFQQTEYASLWLQWNPEILPLGEFRPPPPVGNSCIVCYFMPVV